MFDWTLVFIAIGWCCMGIALLASLLGCYALKRRTNNDDNFWIDNY